MANLKKLLYLTLPFLFYACLNNSKNVETHNSSNKNSLDSIIKALALGNCVESEYVGAAGQTSSQWSYYEQLQNMATIEQLIDLTNHKSGVVRCYAFEALLKTKHDTIFSVLLKHSKDTLHVITRNGCLGGTELVSDYFVKTIRYNEEGDYQLNARQQHILDSVFIYDKSNTFFWGKLFAEDNSQNKASKKHM